MILKKCVKNTWKPHDCTVFLLHTSRPPQGLLAEKAKRVLSLLFRAFPDRLQGTLSGNGAVNNISAFEMFPLGTPSIGDCFEKWTKIKHQDTNDSLSLVMNKQAKSHVIAGILPVSSVCFCFIVLFQTINKNHSGLQYHYRNILFLGLSCGDLVFAASLSCLKIVVSKLA